MRFSYNTPSTILYKTEKKATIDSYESVVKLHISPFFDEFNIHKIHQRDIFLWQEYIFKKILVNQEHKNASLY